MGGALPPWHGGIHPPSPRIPPYYMSKCRFGGDNTLSCANKFLGKKCPFLEYLFDMKKKYIITESQLKLLESGGAELFVMGCLYGGFWVLSTILQAWEDSVKDKKRNKEELERLQKINDSKDLVIELIKKNDNKGFSVDICELKNKSVKFSYSHLKDKTEYIEIKEGKFIGEVNGSNIKTYVKLIGNSIGKDDIQNIELKLLDSYAGRTLGFFKKSGVKKHEFMLENYQLQNYIMDDLKFPIMEFKLPYPKMNIKTDF